MLVRPALLIALAACASTRAPAPPPSAPPSTPSDRPVAPAPPPVVAPPKVADADPGFAFLDADRRTKLTAAFPQVDAAVEDEMKKQDLPGLAIGIVIDGELAYAKGFGVTDLETKTRPDADTVYRIGSISKSFAGLAILALRDDGALDLDDPLARWIPEAAGLIYPTGDARPISLRQLLTHTSGLPRMGPFDPNHAPDEATVVKSLDKLRLDNAPGTAAVYSNLGFSLLGIVAAHAAHRPYHELLAKRLFGPLGMTSTYWDHADVPKGKLATAYQPGPTGPKAAEPIRLGAADAAGGIYSTVRDMARYAALQLSAYPPRTATDDGPLRRATLREAHSTGFAFGASAGPVLAPKKGEPLVELHADTYGFGWVAGNTCDYDDLVWHNGAIDSYRSDLRFMSARGVGVVVLTNFGRANTGAVGGRIVAELAKTGALAKRVQRPAAVFDERMKQFLAVYNQWDEAAYKAMLDPMRGPVPEEKDELAGYKQLHGACTTASVLEVRNAMQVRFKVACERGSFVMAVDLAPSGLIGGFIGTSRDVAAPPDIAQTAAALTALIGKWDERAYTRALPKAKLKPADAKQRFADLRAQHGACRVKAPVHDGFDWRFELDCERNADLVLNLAQDPKDKSIADFGLRLLGIQPGSRCPTR